MSQNCHFKVEIAMEKSPVWEICEEIFEWQLREFPEFATFCGVHDSDDKLNDHTVEAFTQRKKDLEGFLLRCEELDTSSLLQADRLNLDLILEDLRTFLTGYVCEAYVYGINCMDGMPLDFGQLTSWMKFETLEDYKKYFARVKALPERIARDIECAKHGISTGYTHHQASMEGVPEQLEEMSAQNPEETDFYAPFLCVDLSLCTENLNEIKKQAVDFIKDKLQPSIRELRNFVIQEYLPKCREGVGISSVPNGEAVYDVFLKFHTSLNLTAKEVHEIGLKEVSRIRAEMEEVKASTGFKGDLASFTKYLKTDSKFFFKDKESLLKAYRDITYSQIRPLLNKLFHKIPSAQLTIEPVPPGKPGGIAAYYLAGTLDGSRPGKVYVNANDMGHCPSYDLMTLALHEGEPGHHFQGMYAVESNDLPRFRRYMEDMYYSLMPTRFSANCAYSEGWGLYCEYLGNEFGLYKDPYSRFGHLGFEMHRACRLVADTGLHAFGWTREEAEELFRENTPLAEVAIRNEVRRYITWPAQACAYKIGQLKILELRKKAKDAIGDRFDVRDFHQEVLQCGMVPLTQLERIIDSYITRMQKT